MTKKIVQIVLVVAIIVITYFIYNSIAKPIRFKDEKDRRYAKVIERLKDIRTAQLAFFDKYSHYTANFDSLINFIKVDSLPIVMAIGNVPDTMTEEQALKAKLIRRDTINVAVRDTIFPKNFISDSLKYIPFTDLALFQMQVGEIMTGSKIKVKVFEVVDTKPFDPTDVLKVGSLTEATTTGNWE